MFFLNKRQTRDGFSFIELMVVLGIIAILAIIVFPFFKNMRQDSTTNACYTNQNIVSQTYSIYLAKGGNYNPVNTSGVGFLITAGLLVNPPICKDGGTYSWWADVNNYPQIKCSIHGSNVVVAAPVNSNLLYQQTAFDSSKTLATQGVVPIMGTWSTANGGLIPRSGTEARAIFANSSGTNYTISATVNFTSGNGYGIYYHATNTAQISGYVFQFDPGLGNRFAVRKVVNGSEQPQFQSVSMASVMPDGFSVYGSHNVSISTSGANQVIKVDGVEVLNFSDSTFASGYVGARSWDSTVASINNMSVVSN
ncbi:MAG: prepilin-type N-terminal cleavage/methylation domain-containing protein [Bacillota bacterium]